MTENYKKNFIRKKRLYCSNCGKYGHKYVKCNEPITSIGIIAIKLKDDNDYLKFISLFKDVRNYNVIKANTISYNLLLEVEKWKDKIDFLMIRRKKTLGYLEFMRGRYEIKDILHLTHLIEQMTTEEINDIINYDFEYLWKDLWKTNAENKFYKSEFDSSMIKFNKFKKNNMMINICKKIDLKYSTPEWGFPKGRRNFLERNIDCAKREFEEETGLSEDNYYIFENINPLSEVFHGTNDILYKHIYYLAICKPGTDVFVDKNNLLQYEEIGDIGWYDYNKCCNLIRFYHNERQKVLNEVFLFVMSILHNKFEINNIINENIMISESTTSEDDIIYIDIDDSKKFKASVSNLSLQNEI